MMKFLAILSIVMAVIAFVSFVAGQYDKSSLTSSVKTQQTQISESPFDRETDSDGTAYSAKLTADEILQIMVIQDNLKQPDDHMPNGQKVIDKVTRKKLLVNIPKGTRIKLLDGNMYGPGIGISMKFIYEGREYYSYDRWLFNDYNTNQVRTIYQKKSFPGK